MQTKFVVLKMSTHSKSDLFTKKKIPVQVVDLESDIQFLYHNEIALEVVQSQVQHIHVEQ